MNRKKVIVIASAAAVVCAVVCAVVLSFGREKPKTDTPAADESMTDRHVIYEGDPALVAEMSDERNETYVIGVSSMFANIHPYTHNNEAGRTLRELAFPSLLEIKNGNAEYRLAESVVISKEGMEAEVTLKADFTFSDGAEVTAESVAESYRWFMENESGYSSFADKISQVNAVSDDKVHFVFKYPDADIIQVFQIPVVHAVEPDSDFGNAFAGAGDYELERYIPSEQMLLHRRDGAEAKYERVEFKLIDYSDLEKVAEEQNVDEFYITKTEMYEQVKANGAYDVKEDSDSEGWYLVYESSDDQLKKTAAAFSESEEIAALLDGSGSSGIVSAYMADGYYSLLDLSVSAEGKSLEILCGHDESSKGVAYILQQKFKEGGADCSLVESDSIGEMTGGFGADIAVVHGRWQDLISQDTVEEFYGKRENIDALDFYTELEKFLAEKNIMTPLSKDSKWKALLAGRVF